MQHPLVSNNVLSEDQFEALAALPSEGLVRVALTKVFAHMADVEYLSMTNPNLPAEARHFQAGRMAAKNDIEVMLESIFDSRD